MSLRSACIIAFALMILPACSTTPPPVATPQYVAMKKQFDTMAPNGQLTFKSATEFHKKLFSSSDANGDARLSLAEYPDLLVIPPETKRTGLERFDRDRDQHLTEDELLVNVNRLFQRDWNSDGVLTFAERSSIEPEAKPRTAPVFARRPSSGPGRTANRPGGY